MEYLQMTLDEWVQAKEQIRKDLNNVKHAFVRIGYHLRRIEENEAFRNDGYKTLAEFAKAEYGLSETAVSRFKSINKKYSVDGFSQNLLPEFDNFKQSVLTEMLSLPDSDMTMINPETPREAVRELKAFNRDEPDPDQGGDIRDLIEAFYKQNPAELNQLYLDIKETESTNPLSEYPETNLREIVNPAGNRTFRKGMFFMMMSDQNVQIKKFGSAPEVITWQRFFGITDGIFAGSAAGGKTWEKHFKPAENQEKSAIAPAQEHDESGAENVESGAKNVEGGAENAQSGAENAQSGAVNVQDEQELLNEGKTKNEEENKEGDKQESGDSENGRKETGRSDEQSENGAGGSAEQDNGTRRASDENESTEQKTQEEHPLKTPAAGKEERRTQDLSKTSQIQDTRKITVYISRAHEHIRAMKVALNSGDWEEVKVRAKKVMDLAAEAAK